MIKFRDNFNALYQFMSASSVRTLAFKKIRTIIARTRTFHKEPYSIRWLGLINAVHAVLSPTHLYLLHCQNLLRRKMLLLKVYTSTSVHTK